MRTIRFRYLRACLAIAALALLAGCSQPGIPGSTVRWDQTPFLAQSAEGRSPQNFHATAIKIADEGLNLHVQVHGYSPPAEFEDVDVQMNGQVTRVDQRIDVWQITLDSDSLSEPRRIVFRPGPSGTVCSDSSIRFAESRGTLEMSVPKSIVATSPVWVRVERVIHLLRRGLPVGQVSYAFPKEAHAVYRSRNLLADARTPQVFDVSVAETECMTAVLAWQSSKRLTSRISLGMAGETLKVICDNKPPRINHEVQLASLRPDTLYYFEISGSDFAGNVASPLTGSFRTAVQPPANPALIRADAWREMPVRSQQSRVQAGDSLHGVLIGQNGAVWNIGRELSAGRYRISVYSWHDEEGGPITVQILRSEELPQQPRRVLTIPAQRDSRLHLHESTFDARIPFDQIILRSSSGTAPLVTSLRLYESTLEGSPLR